MRTDLLGTDGFQEADVTGITMPIVKHSLMIQDPLEIPEAIHEAFHIARTGRPGPVLVDIPQDLSRADIPYEPVDAVNLPGYQPTTEGNTKQIRLAAKALANSRRPVIYAGGGVINADASKELVELCESDRFPVTCTLMGLGGFPAPHEQWLGMLGMHGTRAANYSMDEADLIVCVGARFDDRITGQAVRVRPAGQVHPHRHRPGGDLQERAGPHPDRGRRQEHPAQADRRVPRAGDRRQPPGRLVAAHRRLAGEAPAGLRGLRGLRDQAAVHGRGAVRGHRRGRRRSPPTSASTRCGRPSTSTSRARGNGSTPAGLGTMGFGLPSAMGAKVARPDDQVVCLAGDGSVIMNIQELATCVTENIPVKMFIMNNGYLGMVRQWQELFWDRRYSSVEMGASPDWVKLAEAFGAKGMRLEDKGELLDGMKTALAEDGPVVVRRSRLPRGELLSDDSRRPSGPRHGGLSHG